MNDTPKDLNQVLENALTLACKNEGGKIASYIPELASISVDLTGIAVRLPDNTLFTAGNCDDEKVTLQSAAKLIVLIGLLEEFGLQEVYNWVRVEPSGDDFASIARLDQFGPMPSNPMLNSGAISLCAHIPGEAEQQIVWLEKWIKKLFGTSLGVNVAVYASEKRTGDRNRSLAYLLKNNRLIDDGIETVLETYFSLCSFEATIVEASYLALILANQGRSGKGTQVISPTTALQVNAIMATCGLYNESGTHLVRTGFPAKSSVSGLIVACAPRHAGLVTLSPRVNRKGTSLRGEIMLQHVSKEMGWHFAA